VVGWLHFSVNDNIIACVQIIKQYRSACRNNSRFGHSFLLINDRNEFLM
jgi:hypothetical protein